MHNFWREQLSEELEDLYTGFRTQMAVASVPKWPWLAYPNGRGKLLQLSIYPPSRWWIHTTQMAVALVRRNTALLEKLPDGGCAVEEHQPLGCFLAPEHLPLLYLAARRFGLIVFDAGGRVNR